MLESVLENALVKEGSEVLDDLHMKTQNRGTLGPSRVLLGCCNRMTSGRDRSLPAVTLLTASADVITRYFREALMSSCLSAPSPHPLSTRSDYTGFQR